MNVPLQIIVQDYRELYYGFPYSAARSSRLTSNGDISIWFNVFTCGLLLHVICQERRIQQNYENRTSYFTVYEVVTYLFYRFHIVSSAFPPGTKIVTSCLLCLLLFKNSFSVSLNEHRNEDILLHGFASLLKE